MGPKSEDWKDDPCLAPPFAVLDYGESSAIVDREGRTFMFEHRAKCFVEELCRLRELFLFHSYHFFNCS